MLNWNMTIDSFYISWNWYKNVDFLICDNKDCDYNLIK